jgi:hypothetical protein
MPIQVLKYVTAAHDIWAQEKSGRRFVARCSSKRMATRIVKLLNTELKSRESVMSPTPGAGGEKGSDGL